MALPVNKYKAIVCYDGFPYCGFQRQLNGPSIQEEIEKALEKIHKHPVGVVASGRTDAKVHALGQVLHFESELDLQGWQWLNALNTILPPDIRFKEVEKIHPDFHARFDAKGKVYKYIYTLDQGDPFAYRTKNRIFKAPDVKKMQEVSRLLLGTHDFSAFTKVLKPGKSPIKTITEIEISRNGPEIELVFHGSGFLRHQVRRMSAALLNIGLGKLSLDDFKKMIANEKVCPYKADGQALYLMEVLYEDPVKETEDKAVSQKEKAENLLESNQPEKKADET